MTSTLGIDLSADPRRTAACSIVWREGRPGRIDRFVVGSDDSTPLGNDELVELIREADLSGIDAPFGWPVAFVEAVRSWGDSEGWPAGTDVTALRYRVTDLRVAARRRPLSVSSDLIGVTAMRCVSILDRLGTGVDRSGLSGPAIEIYPAAALNRWGLTSAGYKGRSRTEARRRLVADLLEDLAGVCEVGDAAAGLCEASDDALDSLVAALAVRARMLGLTAVPDGPDEERVARIEGWIHVPDCEIRQLSG